MGFKTVPPTEALKELFPQNLPVQAPGTVTVKVHGKKPDFKMGDLATVPQGSSQPDWSERDHLGPGAEVVVCDWKVAYGQKMFRVRDPTDSERGPANTGGWWIKPVDLQLVPTEATEEKPDERTSVERKQRVSTDEQNLNKTEKRWLAVLRARGFHVKIHAITFKLAHDTRYTPEFLVTENGALIIWEVKGEFIREDAWIKLKTASRMFPEFVFKMAQWIDNEWKELEVKP